MFGHPAQDGPERLALPALPSLYSAVCIRINEALTQSGPRVPRRKTTGFNLSPFFPTSWVHAAAAAAARR